VETPAEREQRVQRLEQDRASRRGQLTVSSTPQSPPGAVEIAPGRGDLRTSSWSGITPPINDLWLIGGKMASYAKLVTEQPYLGAAVWRMLQWGIRVPLKVYRRIDVDTRMRLYPGDHEIADAVVSPWERGSQADLKQHLLGPVLVHGNSVTQVLDGAGNKLQFAPKDWRFATPITPWRDEIQGFTFDTDDITIQQDVSIDEILHCRYWSPLGPLGISPLAMLGTTIKIEDAAQRYQLANFLNMATPSSGIVASEEFLGIEPAERQALMAQLRVDLMTIYSGPENAGKPLLLPPGLDWKTVGQSAVEVSLIDQRRVDREEVCAVYQIPPPMLGILDNATFSNIEEQREMVYTDCMGPPLVLIEQAINAQVIHGLLRENDIYVEFDFGPVLRGSRLDEINALRAAIASALMTPNEGRGVLNQQRSDQKGMDDFYLPTNNLSKVGEPPVQRGVAPAQSPADPANPGEPVPPRKPQPKPKQGLMVKSRDRDYELEPA
jgi:HK97 family phage portal protein